MSEDKSPTRHSHAVARGDGGVQTSIIYCKECIDLAIYCIANWSPALDFSILIRTPGALLSRKGAY